MGVRVRAVIVLVLLAAGYMTFAPRTDHISLFVAVEQERSENLIEQIAAMLGQKGLKSWISHATDDHGKSAVVLEAVGGNTSIWLSNVTLSGEDQSGPCKRHFEAYPDPQQFEIRFRSRFRVVPNRKNLTDLRSEMEDFLKKRGILNRDVPWSCGATVFAVMGSVPNADTTEAVKAVANTRKQ
jgi:hypothetical protein